MPNCKKKKKKKHSGTKLDQYQPIFLEISSFLCLNAAFSNGDHLGLSICINMKWFHYGTIMIKSDQNTFMFS